MYTAPADLFPVQRGIEQAGLAVASADLVQVPKSSVPLDASGAGKVLRLVDALEDLDDVQAVYANYEVDDEVMAALAGE